MKRLISFFSLFILFVSFSFTAFSFKIDGNNSSVEWDGATTYILIDGESNCGVDFGSVMFKFDYETDALCMCFLFSDPDITLDNINAGISLSIEDVSPFVVTASDPISSENIIPYSFDGAVSVDNNHGATCEIRVGFKSGLPETINCDVCFIDSHGYYSNHYQFVVVNENYQTTEDLILSPTADNTDPAYNPDYNKENFYTEKRTTKVRTTKPITSKIRTTKESTTRAKKTTSTRYKHTNNVTSAEEKTTNITVLKSTKAKKTQKETVKVIYYEKEIYISEVYVSVTNAPSSVESVTYVTTNAENSSSGKITSDNSVSLSDGTKYKKIIAVAGLAAFITIACIGTYSAKKSSDKSTED